MNHISFLKKKNIVEDLLKLLGIIKQERMIVEIDHTPDFNLSAYHKDSTTDYIFMNKWRIPDNYETLFEFQIISSKIFHQDHIIELSKVSKIPCYDDHCKFLNRLFHQQPSLFEEHGFNANLDEFKLHHLRKKKIDNDYRVVEYEGSFLGDSHCIDPFDWKLYATVEVEGMPFLAGIDFYKSLISESCSLWKEHKNKLSYFLLHAAFESFVNVELNAEEQRGRFADKLNELFTRRFGVLSKHEIYSALTKELHQFSKTRNLIAHGKSRIDITEAQLKKAFIFVLTMIAAYQYKCHSFADIENILLKPKFTLE